MTQETIVVAGGSIAGISAARELHRGGFGGRLIVLDKDARVPYRRPEVSKSLIKSADGEKKAALAWPSDIDAERMAGWELTGLDTDAQAISARNGDEIIEIEYSGLVIATGSEPRTASFQAVDGLHSLRSFADAERFRDELAAARRVVIIGGGFIGLEVASGAISMGKQVTVIETMPLPLAHILGHELAGRVVEMHGTQGVDFRLSAQVDDVVPGDDTARAFVTLTDGSRIAADVVLVAIGAQPAVGWLNDSGLEVTRGVACDATCAVAGAENIVAAGDAALWHNPLYARPMRVEHWANAVEQGTYAARRLLGTHDPAGFVSAPYFWSDQHGRKIQSIGSTFGFDAVEVLDDDPEHYLVAYFHDGVLIAAAGLAPGAAILQFKQLILERAGRDAVREFHAGLTAAVGR
jgi:NADPH-dependent 2,4-dienoyl-CoA reductase/sulfur reductase-like enzyme